MKKSTAYAMAWLLGATEIHKDEDSITFEGNPILVFVWGMVAGAMVVFIALVICAG